MGKSGVSLHDRNKTQCWKLSGRGSGSSRMGLLFCSSCFVLHHCFLGSDVDSEIEIEMEDCANVFAKEADVVLTGEAQLLKTVVSGEFLDLDIDRDDVGEYRESDCY